MGLFSKPDGKQKPLEITIAGEPGIGKTTLAATFKSPAFIKFEDGTRALKGDFVETPLLTSYQDGLRAVKEAGSDGSIATIVIDSITHLEAVVEREIVENDPKATSIADAMQGFGKGGRAVGQRMANFKKACENTGKNIVYLAQTNIKKNKSVDIAAYNVLTLRLSDYSLPPFIDLVDCVAFLRLKLYDQRGGAEKVVLSSNKRELICHAHATITAKNRLGIDKPLDCPEGVNPIIKHIKSNLKGD